MKTFLNKAADVTEAFLHKKIKFFINDFLRLPADLVKFTEKIHDRKLHFLCNAYLGPCSIFVMGHDH